ncbi:MAG: type IX secretion system sortase PorU [Flavobacteriia bacterium]|nr:type IX secretion system sortase PorU [Flavobacteriia bacterium]
MLNEVEISLPLIEGQSYKDNIPHFSWLEEDKNIINCNLISIQKTIAPAIDVNYLKSKNIVIPSVLDCQIKIVHAKKQKFITVNLLPYVSEGGIIYRVNSIEFHKIHGTEISSPKQKSFANSSVLNVGSGLWYKIKVNQDGVYKIDKAFLESCGISVQGLNPNDINIYGNGSGRLSELNNSVFTDDLAKNAIFISGDGDGVFNDQDYILFYGWGPSKSNVNSTNTGFTIDQNIYSDYSVYFININSLNTPLRINSIASVNSAVTNNVSSYSYFVKHEVDSKSLIKGGQRWYGEEFDTELSQTFNFNIPNIIQSVPVLFNVAIASNSTSSLGTSQIYSVNGTTLYNTVLPSASSESYGRSPVAFSYNNPLSSIDLNITINRNNPSALTYLDNILLNCRRGLTFYGSQMNFRDLNSVGLSNISEFSILNSNSNTTLWDISNRQVPMQIIGTLSNSTYVFRVPTDSLKEFVVFDGINYFIPTKEGGVSFQNLHGLSQADYLIVTDVTFVSQAERLADLHRGNGLIVHVVTTEQIYNEFSSGMKDPTAIKRFAKMFYDRSIANSSLELKYLLLFGDGTYDPKNRIANNNNYVPTYQVLNSEDHISALVSDDYFGLLDDNESFEDGDLLDIGVGRLLISSNQIAKEQVDKIEHYMKNGSDIYATSNCCGASKSNSTYGDWRQKYVLIADDYEATGNFVPDDAEPNYLGVKLSHPELNCDKIYIDAYPQISTAGGQRYPEVNEEIDDRIANGVLLMNYIGHGGEVGAAAERIITIPQIQSWSNINKLNLFVSATCEFTKYDDPSRVSAGEWVSLNPKGGAIALMTTTRAIYIGVNTDILNKFYKNVFERDVQYLGLPFGEIIRLTKNQSLSMENKRCFTLIGDPALRLALPQMNVVTDSINSVSPQLIMDTLRALSKVTIKGHLVNNNGTILTNFNGVLTPTIFDKPKQLTTLGQDQGAPLIPFELQKNALFKGMVSVKNGYFDFSFIVPKDINYSFGPGKISYYADNRLLSNTLDAGGVDERFIVGGIDPNGVVDHEPPIIKMYLNDEKFVDGGETNETPTLIAKIEDNYGVNTVGNGIGHDVTVVLDGETSKPIILNNYYSAALDSYQQGEVNYTFPILSPGTHTLTFKVWDINDNSAEQNYPNPFTTKTDFYFEHNQVCSNLDVQIQIYTVSGKVIKTINKTVSTIGFRSDGITWDGKDDFGDDLAKGVYIYKLSVRSETGEIAEKIEKLFLLK